MMSQLGTRLLFFEVPTFELTDVQLLDYARDGKPDESAAICNQAVNTFLHEFYQLHPIGCVEPDSVRFPEQLLEELVRWAQLLVKGGAEVLTEKDNGEPEPRELARESLPSNQKLERVLGLNFGITEQMIIDLVRQRIDSQIHQLKIEHDVHRKWSCK